jgi:hypothetical protein
MIPGNWVPGGGQGNWARVSSWPGVTFETPLFWIPTRVLKVRPLLGRLPVRREKFKLERTAC